MWMWLWLLETEVAVVSLPWGTIIPAIGVILVQLYAMHLSSKRAEKSKQEVAEVKQEVVIVKGEVAGVHGKVDATLVQVKEIEKATNSIVKKNEDEARASGKLQGAADERSRKDTEDLQRQAGAAQERLNPATVVVNQTPAVEQSKDVTLKEVEDVVDEAKAKAKDL